MKKVIGIIGIGALAAFLLSYSGNNIGPNTLNLDSLMTMINADAECTPGTLGRCFLSPSGTYACYYDPVGGECAP
jgi:hypothetical protein